jgi:hypothetical protein
MSNLNPQILNLNPNPNPHPNPNPRKTVKSISQTKPDQLAPKLPPYRGTYRYRYGTYSLKNGTLPSPRLASHGKPQPTNRRPVLPPEEGQSQKPKPSPRGGGGSSEGLEKCQSATQHHHHHHQTCRNPQSRWAMAIAIRGDWAIHIR